MVELLFVKTCSHKFMAKKTKDETSLCFGQWGM